MKNFIIIFFVVFAAVLNAQNKDLEQSIELPDFVITGVQSVDIPTITKRKAELMPVLGKQFFNPSYQPEKLNNRKIDVPFNDAPDILKMDLPLNYRLEMGAGRYTLPKGLFSVGGVTSNIFFNAKLWGNNVTEFIGSADYSEFGADIETQIFTSNNSSFLPGLKISLNASYRKDNFLFYQQRVLTNKVLGVDNIVTGLNLNYDTDAIIQFGGSVKFSYLDHSRNDLNDKSVIATGMIKYSLSSFNFKMETKYIDNVFTNNYSSLSTSESYMNSYISTEFGNNKVKIGGGLFYSIQDSNTFVFPKVYIAMMLNDFVTFKGEAGGESNYISYEDHYNSCRYLTSNVLSNYVEKDLFISASLTYEFKKYFQLEGGAGYSHYNNYYYLDDISYFGGDFGTLAATDLKRIHLYANANFHLGPMGALYANAEFQQFTFSDDLKVPYEPMLKTEIEYSYKFADKIGFGVMYILKYDTYADRSNSNLLDTYHNLGANFSYELFERFNLKLELQNILNRDNFVFNGYREKPFDIIAGFTYSW